MTLPLPNKPKKSCGDVPSSNPLLTTSSTGICTPLSAHSPRWMLHRRHFKGIFKRFFYKVWEKEGKMQGLGSGPRGGGGWASLPCSPGMCTKQSTVPLYRWSAQICPDKACTCSSSSTCSTGDERPPRRWPAGPSRRRGGPRGLHPVGPPWLTAPPWPPPAGSSSSRKARSWWAPNWLLFPQKLMVSGYPGAEPPLFPHRSKPRNRTICFYYMNPSLPGSATLPKLQAASFPDTSGTFQNLLSAVGTGPSPQISN